MAKIISSVQIDLSDMSAVATSRQLNISGERGSKFNLQVFNSSGAFYDFTSKAFANGFISTNNLNITLGGGTYNTTLNFPASSGATYYILLFSTPESDTEFSKVSGAAGKYIFSKSITQVANAVLTLAPTNAGSGMKTMPSSTLTASTTTIGSTDVSIDWGIENVETDGGGFGLRLIRQPLEGDWYFQTTETVDGAITSATEVKVDDLTDLTEGMLITAVSSGSLSGTPTITAIDTNEKTLTLSVAQTFADGITLTLRARGSNKIRSATGVNLSIGTITATETELTKTVRTAPSSTTVNLNGTYGIAGGGHVKMKGLNVNNATANTVQSVSASSSAGSMVMSLDQTGVTVGTTLTFKGSVRIITLTGTVTVNAHPDTNRTINLDVDQFITLGAAS